MLSSTSSRPLFSHSSKPASTMLLGLAWPSHPIGCLVLPQKRTHAAVCRNGGIQEMSPQQFELEAGCHSRKWRNSFRVQSEWTDCGGGGGI
jgi:hypothetical protein